MAIFALHDREIAIGRMMSLFHFLASNARWLAAGALLMFLSSFGQTSFISLFAGEVRTTFALTQGEWGLIYTIGTTASAIVMVWAGMLSDYFRVRTLGPTVLCALILACLSMSWVSSAWALPFVIFALRFAGQGMSSHLAMVAMARWFVATRGRAISIATLGFSLGEAFLPMIFVSAMAEFQWQTLWVFSAVITALGIPILLLLLRSERTPKAQAQETASTGLEGRHWRRREVLRHPLFWATVPSVAGLSAFGTAFFFHQVHFCEVKDWSHLSFVTQLPLYSGTAIVAMLIAGGLVDRFGPDRILPFIMVPFIIGAIYFASLTNLNAAFIGFILLGVTAGYNGTVMSSFWATIFGTRYIGSIKSLATAVMVFGSAIGPGITGVLIDLGFGFDRQLYAIAVYFVFSSLLVWITLTRAKAAPAPRP